jgi:hypothetical protein
MLSLIYCHSEASIDKDNFAIHVALRTIVCIHNAVTMNTQHDSIPLDWLKLRTCVASASHTKRGRARPSPHPRVARRGPHHSEAAVLPRLILESETKRPKTDKAS